jgi:hypothetical protein
MNNKTSNLRRYLPPPYADDIHHEALGFTVSEEKLGRHSKCLFAGDAVWPPGGLCKSEPGKQWSLVYSNPGESLIRGVI